MHLADDPKTDAISAGINLRHVGTKQHHEPPGRSDPHRHRTTSAIKLMKSTHHCFSIANQYFVMEEDLFDYFHKLAEGASE